MSCTEVPLSYQIAGGLSCIGALLKRNRWVDQVDWRVYPNQSVLFVGPSGIGKDTLINRVQNSMHHAEPYSRVPTLGGKTLEVVQAKLARLGRPACAYIPAGEATAFFGRADYQANMMTGITDLLSTGERVDIGTKGGLMNGGPMYIEQPTLTMHLGSTVEWLHKFMPDGTLEGGFMGRFLIVPEEFGRKHVALVGEELTPLDRREVRKDLYVWQAGLEHTVATCKHPREMILLEDAVDVYTNWYHNRFHMFSKVVMPYANRSRDMVLRLAMLMALSRGHDRYVEGEDVQFAIGLIREVAARIDKVVLPPNKEALLMMQIMARLPTTEGELFNELGQKFAPLKEIRPAIFTLRDMGRLAWERDGVLRKKGD